MITILTPTYNRAFILVNAFNSLCRQTDKGFEWIIVDDGSSDNTKDLVDSWKSSTLPFELRYIKQNNGGKHRALNRGIKEARYEYIMILDSDDYLTDNAVSRIKYWISTIENEENFAGVSGLKGLISTDKCVGGFGRKGEYIDAKYNEKRRYNLNGDKAEVYRTKLLREYPFPEFTGEKFCSENAVWYAIAKDGYKLRWFREVIYKCEYRNDGLTKEAENSYNLPLKNFQGFTLSSVYTIELEGFPLNYFTIGFYYHIAKIKGLSKKEI